MRQEWHDLLFAHWACDASDIRPLVPRELELDLWQDRAYIGVTPFHLRGLRPRGLPALPVISQFLELNVRTYVRFGGLPGVYFFSLDAANLSAVLGARFGYGLPYYHASMGVQCDDDRIAYRSRRLDHPAAEFRGSYRPSSEFRPWCPPSESLERFLTERYCLYRVRQGRVYRAHIHHIPWPLQEAEATIEVNTMAKAAGIALPPDPPILHFSKFIDVLVWLPERVQ